jgi:hypothetical protein
LRIKSELSPDLKPLGEAAKTVLNSLYGQLLQDKSKWSKTKLMTRAAYTQHSLEGITCAQCIGPNLLEVDFGVGTMKGTNP